MKVTPVLLPILVVQFGRDDRVIGVNVQWETAVSPQTFIASNPKSAYTAGNQKNLCGPSNSLPHFFAIPRSKAKPT
jgi:hypothetical protein